MQLLRQFYETAPLLHPPAYTCSLIAQQQRWTAYQPSLPPIDLSWMALAKQSKNCPRCRLHIHGVIKCDILPRYKTSLVAEIVDDKRRSMGRLHGTPPPRAGCP